MLVTWPLHVLDRITIQRRTPLRLTGAVPADLTALRTRPAAIAGHEVAASAPLRGDYLGEDRHAAALTLLTRDAYRHDVWLLHPEVLPAQVRIPAGAAGQEPVTAELVAGAPYRITVRLPRPLRDTERFRFVARRNRLIGREVITGPLDDRRLRTAAAVEVVEMRAPFALPAGKLQIEVVPDAGTGFRSAPVDVVVEGTTPGQVEFVAR